MRLFHIGTGSFYIYIPVLALHGKPCRCQHIDSLGPHQHAVDLFVAVRKIGQVPGYADTLAQALVLRNIFGDIRHRLHLFFPGLGQILIFHIPVITVRSLDPRPVIQRIQNQDIGPFLYRRYDRSLHTAQRAHIGAAPDCRHLFRPPLIAENNTVGALIDAIIKISKFSYIGKSHINGLTVPDNRRIVFFRHTVHIALPAFFAGPGHKHFLGKTVDQCVVLCAIVEPVIEKTPDSLQIHIAFTVKPARMHVRHQVLINNREIIFVLYAVILIEICSLVGVHIVVIIKLEKNSSHNKKQKYRYDIRNRFFHSWPLFRCDDLSGRNVIVYPKTA